MLRLLIPLLAIVICARAAEPHRDLHVDPKTGDDAHDGVAASVRTIARALKLAQAGDTVHLANARYKESVAFHEKRGVTLDGHGAILDGAEPLSAADWQMISPGLYRHDHLLTMDPAILMRWFFVFDGKMNHMSRTSKGRSAALKKPEDLAPGEWTYVQGSTITRDATDGKPQEAQHAGGAFFIKIDPTRTLDDYHIEAPLRSSGVSFSGQCEDLVIRHLTATHVYNDGFNIHGNQRGLVFENIAAIDCGDDGFSAHEAAECRVDCFVSIGNSTGLCDTASSVTHFKNVFIKGCLGFDVFFMGDSAHSIENAWIESSAAHAVSIDHIDTLSERPCATTFKNVFIRRVGAPQEVRVGRNASLTPDSFAEFQKLVASEPGSRWTPEAPADAGANETALRKLVPDPALPHP